MNRTCPKLLYMQNM